MADEKIQVLVADDSEAFLEAACAWIKEQPELRVSGVARNGAEAVEAAGELQPDLVLMDAFMPQMDGFEATRKVKELDGAPWIVMVSLHDDDTVRDRCREAGADGFVSKASLSERLPELLRVLGDRAGT